MSILARPSLLCLKYSCYLNLSLLIQFWLLKMIYYFLQKLKFSVKSNQIIFLIKNDWLYSASVQHTDIYSFKISESHHYTVRLVSTFQRCTRFWGRHYFRRVSLFAGHLVLTICSPPGGADLPELQMATVWHGVQVHHLKIPAVRGVWVNESLSPSQPECHS